MYYSQFSNIFIMFMIHHAVSCSHPDGMHFCCLHFAHLSFPLMFNVQCYNSTSLYLSS
jgi:hypothetical protein